uniref:RING-type domain-containing protein n=1 Tax=Meloidogyne enterolobii TaxID=390850 RepID=A0A6V7UKC4_MELEN|nr:unnamed protein product [Meloidogyne enterolobii]
MKNKRRGRPATSAVTRKSPRKEAATTERPRRSGRNSSSVESVNQPKNGRWEFRPRTSHGSGQGTSHSAMSRTIEMEASSDENDEDFSLSLETLKSLFNDQIIDEIQKLSPGARLMAMANYIIENPGQFRAKPKKKVTIPDDELEPTFASIDSALSRDANFHPKLLDAFFQDFRDHYKLHFSRSHYATYDKEVCNRLLHQHFPSCRTPLIEFLVDEFSGRYSTAAWICFFVESNLGYMVRNFCLLLEMRSWSIMSKPLPLPRKRRNNWIPNPTEGSLADSIKEFTKVLKRFRNDYKQLFCENEDRLLPNVEQIENLENIEKFECLVCTGEFAIDRAIGCNYHPIGQRKNIEIVDLVIPWDKEKVNFVDNTQTEKHLFCVECLIGHAKAATQEMPLAKGGVGLQCMASNCPNAILFSECRFYIPPNIRRHLNARILEENLGAANLENLERCTQCNFSMIIDIPYQQLRVFSCQKCKAQHCRKCKHAWDDIHFGRNCEDLLNVAEERKHNFENRLSEAIIRRCYRCSVPFVKLAGCNQMSCRCGAVQCYLCRAKDINYSHFCQHFRNPKLTGCSQCKKTCLLWHPEDYVDSIALNELRKEAEEEGIEL